MDKTMKTETVNSKNPSERLLKVKPKLAVEYRSIATIWLDPKNPRIHNQKQIRQIARSIQLFGFIVPILINAEMQVVVGHGRLQACKLLGLTEVATIKLEHLTKAQLRAFMIADNRLTENSVWDERLLGEHFKALSVLELDFSIDVTGLAAHAGAVGRSATGLYGIQEFVHMGQRRSRPRLKNSSTAGVYGLLEYAKREAERAKAAQQATAIAESRPCPGCDSVMRQRISGGLRCAQCGAQWSPQNTQPHVRYPTRKDFLDKLNFRRF